MSNNYLHRFPSYFAVLLLLSPWCVCLSATLLLHQAGNSSFTTAEQSSFWSSDGGNYTFGFKAIDDGEHYLLSIWHSHDPNKTAIWWPDVNASAPPLKSGATLRFSRSGRLELYNASSSALLLWSSNISSSNYAALLDTGNLVLFESNKEDMAWQSFDESRDSLILLAGLDVPRVSNKPYLLQSRSNQLSYAAGDFHLATDALLNVYFHALDSFGNDFVYLYANMNTSKGFYIGWQFGKQYTSNSLNQMKRVTLDYDGNLRVYMWESNVSAWMAEWQILDDKCMLGSPCGPFGICTLETDGNANGINCSCPPGYHPRKDDDMSQGCQASISFNASCGTGHASNYTATIVEVPNSDYDYNDLEKQPNLNIEQCKQRCLNNCACMAASYRSDNTCFLKGNSNTGYLLNGYASDSNTLLIKVTVESIIRSDEQKQGRQWVIGVGVAVALAVLMIAGLSAWLLRQRRRGKGTSSCLSCWRSRERHGYEAAGEVGPVRFYRYKELLHATRNFSEKLGEGGFGIVYKGWIKLSQKSSFDQIKQPAMTHNNTSEFAVAVKVLKTKKEHDGGDGAETQFRAEVRTLGKIHHINLVSLLGYCFKRGRAGEERMLVYEYMENGSLEKFLFTESHKQLAWSVRFSIALGAARGVAYLHHECSPPIVHCDIKPHNILLDTHFIPKVCDFGFARRFHVESHITMSGIHGTRGYLAPEWLTAQEQLTSKVDVFSFGMLLLELVHGFKAVDQNVPLLQWASQCITRGEVHVPELDTMHQDQSSIVQQEAVEKLRVLKVGMWCIQHNPSMRPTMLRVVQLIEGNLAIDDPPIPRSVSDVDFPSLSSGPSDSHLSSSASTYNVSYSVVSAR